MPENRTRFAILGALTVRPMSGYDLKHFFEQGVSFFWAESYGQIYPILKQLAAEGLVAPGESAAASPGRGGTPTGANPRRAVYAITPAGRDVLAAWLAAPAGPPPGRRLEILLKLFFARQAAPDVTRRLVAEFRAQQVALLARYAATESRLRAEDAQDPDLPFWLLTLRYGQRVSEALVGWCDEAVEAGTPPDAA